MIKYQCKEIGSHLNNQKKAFQSNWPYTQKNQTKNDLSSIDIIKLIELIR